MNSTAVRCWVLHIRAKARLSGKELTAGGLRVSSRGLDFHQVTTKNINSQPFPALRRTVSSSLLKAVESAQQETVARRRGNLPKLQTAAHS